MCATRSAIVRALLLPVFVFSALLPGCGRQTADRVESGTLENILSAHQGKVLLLLLGRDDCPGTAKSMPILDDFARRKTPGVSVVRLDVPLPDEALEISRKWSHSFPRLLDKDRKIAGQLEFFYYPTLYVFDPDGEMRFSGSCDKDRIETMTSEILSEKPGDKKVVYTLPMPAPGVPAPAFSRSALDGETVDVESLLGERGLLIFFGRTSCPFSMKQLAHLEDLAKTWQGRDVATVIINQYEESDVIRPAYAERCPEIPVISDQSGDISLSYGVDAVPFFFLLDGDGKIVKRRSFTHESALNSVNAMLGLAGEKSRFKPTEAG